MRLSGRRSPSQTRAWTQPPRVIFVTLAVAHVVAFAAQLLLQTTNAAFLHEYLALSHRGIDSAYAWQFASAIFLHDGLWFFVINMLLFYALARDIESILGQRHFLALYLSGALAGCVGHLLLMPYSVVALGAAGGIAAVVIAYAMILPELELMAIPLGKRGISVKATHLATILPLIGIVLALTDRSNTVGHSVILGGCVAGWTYTHLLGFGRASFLRRMVQRRREEVERLNRMTSCEFIAREIDPVLEKIARHGMSSLSRRDRRLLAQARQKIG